MMMICFMLIMLLLNTSMLETSLILSFMLITLIMSYTENFNIIMFNSNFNMDKISFTMISLSIFSLILILISSNEWSSLSILLKWILSLLYMCFISSSLISFYMFFEAVLMPTMFLITLKGKSSERLQAGIYLLIYTISGSLPLLLGILLNKNIPSFLLNSIFMTNFLFPLIFIMAFMVKLPTFFLHLWLPKAHVEAPLEGSMILASIILKLGGYGMIRFSKFLLKMSKIWTSLIISLSMISMIFTSMNCLRQKDLKALIAYSSIAHMALILSSLFTFFSMGEKGSIMMMIMHGMTSSALFFLITILYKNFHSRNILNLKGLLLIFPSLTLWWFIFLMLNFSIPPSIGLISEILMFSSMIQINNNMFWLITITSMSVFSFSIILFSTTSHNSMTFWMSKINSSNKEFLSMMTHLFPIIMLSSKPEMLFL